jgi:outer membrane protein assembly factor BamB
MKCTFISLAVLVTAILLIFLAPATCGIRASEDDFEWPRWRGPNGDGISKEKDWNPKALTGGPKILWKADLGGGYTTAAVMGDRLYTMGRKSITNTIYCIDAGTGKEIWRYSFENYTDPHCTPTIDGENIYALTADGILLCLKIKNGKLKWKKDLVNDLKAEKIPQGFSGSPIIEGDRIILNVNTAGMALDKNTGNLAWASAVHAGRINEYGYHSTPVIYNQNGNRRTLILGLTGLFLVDPATGKAIWFYERYHINHAPIADPVVNENRVFISTNTIAIKPQCVLLDISKNKPVAVWQNANMRNETSTPILLDGYLYGCDGTEGGFSLRCVAWNDGKVMWGKKMKMVALTAADGKLIILEIDGTLHIAEASPSSYKEISSGNILGGMRKLEQFWTPPVLCDGRIFCRDRNRFLFCVDVSN